MEGLELSLIWEKDILESAILSTEPIDKRIKLLLGRYMGCVRGGQLTCPPIFAVKLLPAVVGPS